ncbi:Vegetative incompatibility protein HET-E-1 [Colletotrichum sp. SAR 10_65]|nr:Vegetative incompatibility protein HET-E-1 [Colletotrichum sp. SAR 10_65]
MVLGRLRDEIPSFKKDDSFGKPTTSIEDRAKSMSEHTRSYSEKVYFVDEESNEQLQDSEAKLARVTMFEISLETCSVFLFTEYYILVTGQVRVMDLATVLGTDQFRNLLALGVKD